MTREEAESKNCASCDKWVRTNEIDPNKHVAEYWGRCKGFLTSEKTTCDNWEGKS